MATTELDLGRYKLGWIDPQEDYIFKPKKGLNGDIVAEMSWMKGEPDWMRQMRLRALKIFERKPMAPWFAVNMPDLDFQDIYYYIKPIDKQVDAWDQLPDSVKQTYEKLGIHEAERKYLAGVTAQYESEVVYHRNREDLEAQGVLFTDMDTALREYPDLVKENFGTVIPPGDNKFAALNSAVWSGGSFIYVPPGVEVEMPLQAYFRINAENMGQFERTLIIVDEDAYVHYVEGCTAPIYSSDSLHSAVVEIIAQPRGPCPYIRIDEDEVEIGHEATVSKIGEEQLFYLMSRGLSEAEASAMIVSGFVEPITKELPLEYAVEMNRLIQLQMEGSVG